MRRQNTLMKKSLDSYGYKNGQALVFRCKVCPTLLVLSFLGAMIACSGAGSSSSTGTTPPPPPTMQSITLGPNHISIISGTTQQFSATATFSDGSTKDVTSTATWTASAANIANVNSSGLATTLTEGT